MEVVEVSLDDDGIVDEDVLLEGVLLLLVAGAFMVLSVDGVVLVAAGGVVVSVDAVCA